MDLKDLERFFKELPQKLDTATHRAIEISALVIERDLREIFKTEGRSHGVEWSPLKEAYLKWKIKKGFSEKKLHRTTTLAQSFTSVIKDKEAIVGTPVYYAIFHEYGTRRGIPPRPFMTPVFQRFIQTGGLQKAFRIAFREVFHAS